MDASRVPCVAAMLIEGAEFFLVTPRISRLHASAIKPISRIVRIQRWCRRHGGCPVVG
jgi:hypothetical protein